MTLYFLSRLAGALGRRLSEAARTPTRELDPIDHPAIAAMSSRELADLPLSPERGDSARASPPGPDRRFGGFEAGRRDAA